MNLTKSKTANRLEDFIASTGLAATAILGNADIAESLSYDGQTVNEMALKELASRIEIVYNDGVCEIFKVVTDSLNLDDHITAAMAWGDDVSVGSIEVDDDLVEELIKRLRESGAVTRAAVERVMQGLSGYPSDDLRSAGVTFFLANRNHRELQAFVDAVDASLKTGKGCVGDSDMRKLAIYLEKEGLITTPVDLEDVNVNDFDVDLSTVRKA